MDTTEEQAVAAPEHRAHPVADAATLIAALSASAALAACGGGGDSADAGTGRRARRRRPRRAQPRRRASSPRPSMGASRAEIASVQSLGYAAWIDAQFALPASTSRWDALVAAGFADPSFKNGEAGFDACAWRKLLASPDTLRQRVTLALSELMVTSIDSLVGGGWKPVRGGRVPRPARGERVRQLPHADAADVDQHRDGDVPDLSRQQEGQPGDRLAARRELRARADAAVHDRPRAAEPRRQRQADRAARRRRPTRRPTSPAWRASSPAGTSTCRGRAAPSARRRPTSCAGR